MMLPLLGPLDTKSLSANSPHEGGFTFQTALAPSAAPVKPVAPGATGSPPTTGPGGPDGTPAIPPDGPSGGFHESVHTRLFGSLGAQILDNVTGGFYNFAENDALLAFSFQNRDLIDALKAEFNDVQLRRISGAVAQVIENAARHHGLSGIFGFHMLPPVSQDKLLEDMQEAMEDEAAQMRGGSSEMPPPARPQPQRRDPGEFVVPEEVPLRSDAPAGPEFPDHLEPLTFNDFTGTQTPSTPAPLDPETLAGMRRNAELALELEATQGALQEEIVGMRAEQGDVIARGRGEFELERIVRSLSNSFIAGPIQDPDTLNALAQRVLERAGELEADGYPHYALALIEAFQRDYPQFKAANGDEPSRVEQLGPEGSEFTTGENEAERVAEQARRMRENGDPEGALALIADYLRSHGAPMEGATGGANIERSASTAIMNELRNMLPYDLAQIVLEMAEGINDIRQEYRDLILELLLRLESRAEPLRQAINILRGEDINSTYQEPLIQTVPYPPESNSRESLPNPYDDSALEAARDFLEEVQSFTPSPMQGPLNSQPWYGRMLMEAMSGIGDVTPEGLISIIDLIDREFDLGTVDLNLLRELYTALMLVPDGRRTDAHDEAIRRVEEAMRNQGQNPFPVGR